MLPRGRPQRLPGLPAAAARVRVEGGPHGVNASHPKEFDDALLASLAR